MPYCAQAMAPTTREEALNVLGSCQGLNHLDMASLDAFLPEEDESTVIYLASSQRPMLRALLQYLKIKRSRIGVRLRLHLRRPTSNACKRI